MAWTNNLQPNRIYFWTFLPIHNTSFKQPSLFVQAAYTLSAISVNWNGVDDVIMSVDSGLCTVARLLTGIQERVNHSFALGMYALNSNSLAKSVVSNFWRSPRVASSRNFARVCISPAPQSPSPKLETTRSLLPTRSSFLWAMLFPYTAGGPVRSLL